MVLIQRPLIRRIIQNPICGGSPRSNRWQSGLQTKCSERVKQITGNPTTLYRGPYGEYNDTVLKAAEASNHITIQWNIDSLDYKGLTAEQMWERIGPKLQKGSIILMHNGTENTALSLDTLIKNIKGKGYEIVTVSDLIYKDNYTIDNNGVQHKL